MMEKTITVRKLTPFSALICAILLGIGVLLGLLIKKLSFLILLMLPGFFYAAYLMWWVLELNTETGILAYSVLFRGIRSFRLEDIRSIRITEGLPPFAPGEQYEIYVYKKGENGMSERICMPLHCAAELREYLEHQDSTTAGRA